jgi:hypothetical protein
MGTPLSTSGTRRPMNGDCEQDAQGWQTYISMQLFFLDTRQPVYRCNEALQYLFLPTLHVSLGTELLNTDCDIAKVRYS